MREAHTHTCMAHGATRARQTTKRGPTRLGAVKDVSLNGLGADAHRKDWLRKGGH